MIKTFLASASALVLGTAASAQVVGFSQIGSESGWRAAETTVTNQEAEARGIELQFSDAQQKQENQIAAVRSFIAQGVDAILLAPVVATGWDAVLEEAQEAEIPVVLLDRMVDSDPSLYLTAVGSDLVHEGEVAGQWLAEQVGEEPCRVVELQGTTGSSPAIDRAQGFRNAIEGHDNIEIVQSQTGNFTRAEGKTVMEAFLQAENGGADICALYAHNDDMAVGAIQAIKGSGSQTRRGYLGRVDRCRAGHLPGHGRR
jgi:simple sugar transport system substrate-binding protein